MDYKTQLDTFFAKFNQFFDEQVPAVIAESANENFRERFIKKDWDGASWPELSKNYKPKRGTMMLRSSALMNSIRPTTQTRSLVIISAGNSRVPYARIHNEGGLINRSARSETFQRNRYQKGKRKGSFKRGTISNVQGFSFKAYTYNMPQRQFMGHSASLNTLITTRIKALYKIA